KLLGSEPAFDVVVTDYAMPGMNGLELAHNIQQTNAELPVVLASGYAELPPHEGSGFLRLAKPYTQAALVAALHAALAKRMDG
ncbi:MAG: response regulator, partial [Bradyrhizobium sp.]